MSIESTECVRCDSSGAEQVAVNCGPYPGSALYLLLKQVPWCHYNAMNSRSATAGTLPLTRAGELGFWLIRRKKEAGIPRRFFSLKQHGFRVF